MSEPKPDPLPDVSALALRLMDADARDLYGKVIAAVDHAVVLALAARLGAHQVKLARVLGLSRTTLRSKLKRMGMLADGRRRKPAAGAAEVAEPAA